MAIDDGSPKALDFAVGQNVVSFSPHRLFLAGFAGRDTQATERHIVEMMEAGVARPSQVPAVYAVSTFLLTQDVRQDVLGDRTVPEVEFVLFGLNGSIYVTVGNDQCDLELESLGLAEKSKNLCQKAVARSAWLLDEVQQHWDSLRLRMEVDGFLIVDEAVSILLPPSALMHLVLGADEPAAMESVMIFSGTVAAVVAPSDTYTVRIELLDPILGRSIHHDFAISCIPTRSTQRSVD